VTKPRINKSPPFERDLETGRVRWVIPTLSLRLPEKKPMCPACGTMLDESLKDHRSKGRCARACQRALRRLDVVDLPESDQVACRDARFLVTVIQPDGRAKHYAPRLVAEWLRVLACLGAPDPVRVALITGPRDELDRELALGAIRGFVVQLKPRRRRSRAK